MSLSTQYILSFSEESTDNMWKSHKFSIQKCIIGYISAKNKSRGLKILAQSPPPYMFSLTD